jgi:hypothetical protein
MLTKVNRKTLSWEARLPMAAVVCAAISGVGKADLNQHCIRTTEWLVDNSTVIAVVREPHHGAGGKSTVLRTLKGDATQIVWPLKESPFDGYDYYGPPSHGPVRLVFVRETSELLAGVKLGRGQVHEPRIHDVLYGVTQYGQLLLTESDLFAAIAAQLRCPPPWPENSLSARAVWSGP